MAELRLSMLRGLVAVLSVAPLLGGCVAVAAAGVVGLGGLGVVQYSRNEVQQDFPASLDEAWQAALEALRRLEIIPEQSELTKTEGVLVSGELQVRVERHPEGFARVRVRVGTFHSSDHERRARILLDEIAATIESQDELRAWVEKSQAPAPPRGEP